MLNQLAEGGYLIGIGVDVETLQGSKRTVGNERHRLRRVEHLGTICLRFQITAPNDLAIIHVAIVRIKNCAKFSISLGDAIAPLMPALVDDLDVGSL